MGEMTAIEWTDHTFNPWWGCERVSPACTRCYAETFAKRLGMDLWGKGAERRFFGDKHWNEPLAWNRKAEAAGEAAFVFCASMADVFEDRPELSEPRDRLWDLIEATPWLTWLLLTKRPENIDAMLRWAVPPANVMLGMTVEDPQRARERIPHAAEIPGRWFLSCEPLLAPLGTRMEMLEHLTEIEWVICGGESGAGHRPMDPQWARDLRDACQFLEIPFFFKQWGGRTPKAGGKVLDGEEWCERPVALVPTGRTGTR